MDAETARWLGGLAFVAFCALVGAIYANLRGEDKRNAKNTHDLRNHINHNIEPRLDQLERDRNDD